MNTVNSTEAQRLHAAAIHEGGHGCAAELLTSQAAKISLERKITDAGYVSFSGTCTHAVADPAATRTIALAGPMAEAVLAHGHTGGAALRNAVHQLMSASDRQGAGDYSLHDGEVALRLVLANRAAIEARANLEVAKFLGTASAPASQAARALTGAASNPSDDEITLVHFGTNRAGEVVKTYLDFGATNPTQNLGRVRTGFALIAGG